MTKLLRHNVKVVRFNLIAAILFLSEHTQTNLAHEIVHVTLQIYQKPISAITVVLATEEVVETKTQTNNIRIVHIKLFID